MCRRLLLAIAIASLGCGSERPALPDVAIITAGAPGCQVYSDRTRSCSAEEAARAAALLAGLLANPAATPEPAGEPKVEWRRPKADLTVTFESARQGGVGPTVKLWYALGLVSVSNLGVWRVPQQDAK